MDHVIDRQEKLGCGCGVWVCMGGGGGGGKSELENLIQKFHLEDSWLIFILRTNIEIKHTVNSFSDHFHAVFLERKNNQLQREKGYWILNSVLLHDDKYKKEIEKLWNNWKRQKHCFSSVSKWWEEGKKHVRDFTKLYTRATTKNMKTSLEKRIRNIYNKITNQIYKQQLII